MKKHLLILLSLFSQCNPAPAQTASTVYYQFDGTNPLAPAVGTTNLSTTGAYTINSGGQVAKYITLNSAASSLVQGQSVNYTSQITVQLLFHSGYSISATRNALLWQWGPQYCTIEYPYITFTT